VFVIGHNIRHNSGETFVTFNLTFDLERYFQYLYTEDFDPKPAVG